jgi:hypothetical protein
MPSHQDRIQKKTSKDCKYCFEEIEGKPFYLPFRSNMSGRIDSVRCCKKCFFQIRDHAKEKAAQT